MNSIEIGKRIKQAREAKHLTQEGLGKFLGLNKSSIQRYETGKIAKIKLPILENIAFILDVNPSWLALKTDDPKYYGEGTENPGSIIGSLDDYHEPSNIAAVIASDNIYRIPVFESVSAGFGAYASDEILDYIPVMIKNPYDVEDTIAIKVKGDSMYPKIEDGDIIIVRKQSSVDSGDIAVLLLDGEEGLVKKVVYGADWIELHSINPEYKTKRFEGREVLRLRVVGLVIGSYKTF